jgi:hypothetical protein
MEHMWEGKDKVTRIGKKCRSFSAQDTGMARSCPLQPGWRACLLLLICICRYGASAADDPPGVLNWVASEEVKNQTVGEALHMQTEADGIDTEFSLDPAARTISGTARLRFSCPGRLKTFDLCAELAIRNMHASDPAACLFRLDDRVYILGEDLHEIQVDFQGSIRTERSALQEKLIVLENAVKLENNRVMTFFSRCLPFFPSSNRRFARTKVHVHLPSGFQCLSSGTRREANSGRQGEEFVFESEGSKGVALSCGDFRLAERIQTAVPVNLYISGDLDLDLDVYRQRLRAIVDFFVAHFGHPGLPELNLLIQKENFNGGCSFGGYLINFFRADGGPTSLPRAEFLPPMFLHDSRWDSLVHEIAHQWWGGIVSWQKTDDAWISEGLAQYSTLLYMHDNLPEKIFAKLLERMCAGVVQKAGAGKTSEAVKLAFVKQDPVAFQVIVYNKSALIFWMLRDLLGEKKMLACLKRLLKDRRYQCLGSEAFIDQLAGDDPLLKQFFAGWVGRAEVPAVAYRIYNQGGKAWLEVCQNNGPFVFPLRICCRTKAGIRHLLLPIQRARESFAVAANYAELLSVEINAGCIPVRIGDEEKR